MVSSALTPTNCLFIWKLTSICIFSCPGCSRSLWLPCAPHSFVRSISSYPRHLAWSLIFLQGCVIHYFRFGVFCNFGFAFSRTRKWHMFSWSPQIEYVLWGRGVAGHRTEIMAKYHLIGRLTHPSFTLIAPWKVDVMEIRCCKTYLLVSEAVGLKTTVFFQSTHVHPQ